MRQRSPRPRADERARDALLIDTDDQRVGHTNVWDPSMLTAGFIVDAGGKLRF
jgi:hypothetical protein